MFGPNINLRLHLIIAETWSVQQKNVLINRISVSNNGYWIRELR